MGDEGGSAEMGQSQGMFGMLDIVVLGGIACFGVYWFVFRKKKEEAPQIKKLTVVPTLQRSASYDPSFVNKLKNSVRTAINAALEISLQGRNVVVFYGSQTGTAEEFAGRLSKEASRYGMKGMVADPEECEMEELAKLSDIPNSLAIFCMATYGEGDPTDNAQEFYDWLQDGSVDLTGVSYAVFGLGNKTYEHYNAMGVHVDKKMAEMGAARVHKLGLGDDDANIEEDFINWKEDFWPAVCAHFGIEATGDDIKPYDMKNPFLAPVVVNRELFKAGSDRSCFHIEFDISGSKIRYDSGDHVAVYPVNDPDLVQRLGDRFGIDLDQLFTLTNLDSDASKRHPFPCPTTYRTALSHYLDITNPPRANVLKEISVYAEGEDKDFLERISSNTAEGKELYSRWILSDRRHILAVLEELKSLKPPIDHVCEMLPRLNPRYYSISSSPKHDATRIAITAILVSYTNNAGYNMKGVATSWLQSKRPAGEEYPRVPIYVRKSQFRLPFKATVPVIMIGPGTGIAPFRGFIQDRSFVKSEGKPVGSTILYTGCRNKALDFLYDDELDDYEKDGLLTLHCAFSRDQEEKVYVQNLLTKNANDVWRVLEEGGHLYVCGDARHMANDVDKALQEIVCHNGENMDEQKAQEYLKRMRSRGRYSCDVWS